MSSPNSPNQQPPHSPSDPFAPDYLSQTGWYIPAGTWDEHGDTDTRFLDTPTRPNPDVFYGSAPSHPSTSYLGGTAVRSRALGSSQASSTSIPSPVLPRKAYGLPPLRGLEDMTSRLPVLSPSPPAPNHPRIPVQPLEFYDLAVSRATQRATGQDTPATFAGGMRNGLPTYANRQPLAMSSQDNHHTMVARSAGAPGSTEADLITLYGLPEPRLSDPLPSMLSQPSPRGLNFQQRMGAARQWLADLGNNVRHIHLGRRRPHTP